MTVNIDASELKRLAVDMTRAHDAVIPQVQPLLARAGQNMKKSISADFADSWHFHPIAATITSEVKTFTDGAEALAGPDKRRGGAASLAGIALFGGSNGGGGTVRDPIHALDEEVPRLISRIGKIGEDAIG